MAGQSDAKLVRRLDQVAVDVYNTEIKGEGLEVLISLLLASYSLRLLL